MEITVFVVTVAAVIVGLVEAAKRTGLNERFAPLVAILLGIGAAVAASSQGAIAPPVDGFTLALAGITAGLTAAGLYSGTRATIER